MAVVLRSALLVVLSLSAGFLARAADGPRPEGQRLKVAALEAQISVKRAVIKRAWKEVQRLDKAIRDAVTDGAGDGPVSLPEESSAGADKIQSLLDLSFDLESLEHQRQQALQGLLAQYQEILTLEDEVRAAKTSMGKRPVLEGEWTLTLLPQGLKARVFLYQQGTIVTGEYQTENGLSGNFQGTVVSGQVTLERIDSKYGKMGRLEGQIMKDGGRVQGTWYSYDILSGQPLTGPFTLERVSEEGSGTPE